MSTDSQGEQTEGVDVSQQPLAHNYLELQIIQEGRKEYRFPFYEEEMDLGELAAQAFPEGANWLVKLVDEAVVLLDRDGGQEHRLVVGESVPVQGRHIWLVDVRKPPVGSLEAISDPFAGQVWHLRSHQSWVGRRGKRVNHVELNHPTVSRTHATLLPQGEGLISLISESSASPTTVNGETLEPGSTRLLHHGDLVGFGKLMFRFSGTGAARVAQAPLFVKTLGTFLVSAQEGSSIEIRNGKARLLMAMLAVAWGKPVPAEHIMSSFWPDADLTRARKNLSYTVGQWKEAFEAAEIETEDLLLRSPGELRLNPERLGTHDYVEVSRLVRDAKPITSPAALGRLLSLYQGHFLPSVYEGWVQDLRTDLENKVTQTLLSSAAWGLENREPRVTDPAAEAVLELDSVNEEAARILMESALQQAEPQRATEVYQKVEKTLRDEDQTEPGIALVKLYHRAKLGL